MTDVQAAQIEALGQSPIVTSTQQPAVSSGDVVVRLAAAPINPVDVAIAGGDFYAGHPPLPYIPLIEAVGRIDTGDREGHLVYVSGGGLGVSRDGTAAEVFSAPADTLIEISEDDEPAVAAALGTAGLAGWLPLEWRARVQPGETVLVLGATGTAGTVATQAARLLGAGRVVAAGRDERRLASLEDVADAVVNLRDSNGLVDRLASACGEAGADVIFDSVWGDPLAAALEAAATGARIVQMGASAASTATLHSSTVRGNQLEILGYSNFAVPRETLVDAYQRMLAHARDGELRLDVQRHPLAQADDAWTKFVAEGGKHVLTP